MNDSSIRTLEQARRFLRASRGLQFKGISRDEKYKWMEDVLERFNYFELKRRDRGLASAYMLRMTGFSQSQLTRLIAQKSNTGEIKVQDQHRNSFMTIYTKRDKELLAQTDNFHSRLSGPATREILKRQYEIYGDKGFVRLSNISPSHIYNLRLSYTYKLREKTFTKTKSVQVNIGVRRKPKPLGKPGYLRVDTVHQGDLKKKKGVYHINFVDEVTQWEIVISVEKITEDCLKEAFKEALARFPFVIINFHSDNGGEFINGTVVEILNKLRIEQTKSRSGRTNDNVLVEGKNGSIIRKHMGYGYIEQKHAPKINKFYSDCFNTYLNYHRPCGFADITTDKKGKRHKKYKTYQTPYERLESMKGSHKFLKSGVCFHQLHKIEKAMSDNEFAGLMQKAKDRLFRGLGPTGQSNSQNGGIVAEVRRHHDELFHAHL